MDEYIVCKFFNGITSSTLIPKVNFIFNEQDTIKLKNILDNNSILRDKKDTIFKDNSNSVLNINISDAQIFFNKLSIFYYTICKEYDRDDFGDDIFENLWLRLSESDLNNINLFLDRQIEMLNLGQLSKFKNEQHLGTITFLNDSDTSVLITRTDLYDESSWQMIFQLFMPDTGELLSLPLIRFGIYERNNQKECMIGSIQNKEYLVNKRLERCKYLINGDVPEELKNIEPKKVIAIIMFICLMNELEIYEFSIHGLYLLDYEYHKNLGEYRHQLLLEKYPFPQEDDENYQESLKEHNAYYQNEEKIIELKTTKMYELVNRILYHFKDSFVESYPDEADSSFHFKVPKITIDKLNGDNVKEIYSVIHETFEYLKGKHNERR